MEILILVVVMVIVGLIMGVVAGAIWKDNRPIGVRGDYIVSVIVTVAFGFVDWYLIPAMGFSETIKWLGVAFEPALFALFVLWIIRLAKK